MRKDLILVAALAGLIVPISQADPGGPSTIVVPGTPAPLSSPNVEESGQVSERNVLPRTDPTRPAGENLRRESADGLGARGTIGQDGTGFTGQERIGTLPPVREGSRKTNEFRKTPDRAPAPVGGAVTPEPFNPNSVGAPAATQSGGATNSATGETRELGTIPTSSNSSEDSQMSQRIQSQLTGPEARGLTRLAPQDLANIKVSAATGVVTLNGNVPTERAKQDIESAVVHMRGVKSVDNQLTIKGAGARTDNSPSIK